jgi:hypothetical protein
MLEKQLNPRILMEHDVTGDVKFEFQILVLILTVVQTLTMEIFECIGHV